MRAVLSADRTTFTLAGPNWRETCPVSDLPGRLALYRGLRDRRDGAYAHHYAKTVRALEGVQHRLEKGS